MSLLNRIAEHRLVRWFNFLVDSDFHRVAEIRGEVFTLFASGPRIDREPTWEFMDHETGERTPWRAFLDRKKLLARTVRAGGSVLGRIDEIKGYLLDYAGLALDVERSEDESDAEYRERIRAVLLGNTH